MKIVKLDGRKIAESFHEYFATELDSPISMVVAWMRGLIA